MKLLRFLALFFATITRRHRKPPTARTPSPEKPEKSEEDIYFETLDRLFTEFEEMLAQFKAGTLPAAPPAKPRRARETREADEEEEIPLKTGPNWRPVPPPRHPAPIQTRHRPENRTIRRRISLSLRTPTRA